MSDSVHRLFAARLSFLLGALLQRSTEPIRLAPGFENVRPVGDSIEQRLAQAGVWDHLRPLRERQICRQDQRRLFRAVRDDLKEDDRRQLLLPVGDN